MDNKANKDYGGHPERLYIILDNIIQYQGGMGPFYYNLDEAEEWLAIFQDNMEKQNCNLE